MSATRLREVIDRKRGDETPMGTTLDLLPSNEVSASKTYAVGGRTVATEDIGPRPETRFHPSPISRGTTGENGVVGESTL